MTDTDPPAGPRRPPSRRPEPERDPGIWSESVPRRGSARPRPAGPPRPARPRAASPVRRPRRSGRSFLRLAAVFAAGALAGAGVVALTRDDDTGQQVDLAGRSATSRDATDLTTTSSTPPPTTTSTTPLVASTTAAPTTTGAPPPPASPGTQDAMSLAAALSPMQLPSDCNLPIGESESLPNAARDYRGGVHEGIDFICGEYGHDAVAALEGQVVMADASFVDPAPAERVEILDTAKAIGHTPPWTLAMLFGRFVVIDHGLRPGVGHVVTIYAHLNEIDAAIKPGHHVRTGDRVGEVGKAGTESSGTGAERPQAIHLHWEIHIDERFLGQGASGAETSDIYARLFGR